MTEIKGYYVRGGNGSHWSNCEESHWDCKIEKLESEVARLKKWENLACCVEVLLDPLEEREDDPEDGIDLTIIVERAAEEIKNLRREVENARKQKI